MKQFFRCIKKYFTVWWIPIFINFLVIGIFYLGTVFKRDWIIDYALLLFLLNIVGTVISSIVQIISKKWYFIFPQLGIASFLFYWIGIIMTLSPPDYYGTHKKIPKDISIFQPVDSLPSIQDFKTYDLILMNYSQPGIYKFYVNYKPNETGFLYLKVFEITSNDRLSAERIKVRSKIEVEKAEQQLYHKEFTIYEGSWGDKYGSRIELWFQPSDGNEEYKITERNYIVEGWMR